MNVKVVLDVHDGTSTRMVQPLHYNIFDLHVPLKFCTRARAPVPRGVCGSEAPSAYGRHLWDPVRPAVCAARSERTRVDRDRDVRCRHRLRVLREPFLDMRPVQGHKHYDEGRIDGLE